MITHQRIVCAALPLAFICVAALAQNEPRRIGSIDFFGHSGLNLDQIRSALPLRVGDNYQGSVQTTSAINKAVTPIIGRPATDVSGVCCDAQGAFMIYVGLPGTSHP